MRSWIMLLGCLIIGFSACETKSDTGSEEPKVQEIKPSDGTRTADIIRNPVSANKPLDTVNVAKIEFTKVSHDFGTMIQGQVMEHTFKFTNTGTVPLLISNARSTCGCTVPKWPKSPIEPGEKGKIKVKFNSAHKKGKQDKPVTISANTYPAETVLQVKAFVKEKN